MGVGTKLILAVAIASVTTTPAPSRADLGRGPAHDNPVRLPLGSSETTIATTTITVITGDHLWEIAHRQLDAVTLDAPSNRQIARYWRALIELNEGRLRSGDPDLIYPGEVIALPGYGVSGPP